MTIVQIQPPIYVGKAIRKFGYNPDVDASTGAAEDIIAAGGNVYLPDAAVAGASINVASSDAADTAAGTGARTLTVEGLDANFMLQSETISLNGTSNVNLTNSYIRIFRAFVASAGSGETNAGNITIADATGTLAFILAGSGQTEQAAYTVPANYEWGYLLKYNAELANKTAAFIVVSLQVRPFASGVWQIKDRFTVSSDVAYIYEYKFPLRITSKSDIRLRVLDASADNLQVSGGFEVYLK